MGVVRNCLILLLITLVCSDLQAQMRTISGYVRDQANNENLIGATIHDKRQNKGAITNNFGFYSFTITGDEAVLSYSFVGYTSKTISIRVKSDTSIVILLQGGQVLDEVTVRGEYEKIHETSRTGTVNMPVAQIKAIPTFAGEQDVLKSLQLIPGVSGGNEGSSNILVRGGTADQTLILMDGVPIYNPTHLYGLFSSFNPDAVNNVELVKSGFPARYGGRLSGIADITLREGNSNKFSAQATAGLLASRVLLEGPIVKGRTSFLVSGRTSYLTLMRPLLEQKVGNASLDGYKFHDINAKINHRVNSRNRLYASIYSGSDQMKSGYTQTSVDNTDPNNSARVTEHINDDMGWRNLLTSLRWNHEINATRFFNVTAYISDYKLDIENRYARYREFERGETDNFGINYKWSSKLRDTGVKIDFDHIPNTKHYLRYGAAAIRHEFSPGVGARKSTDSVFNVEPANLPATTNELNAYVEDDMNISSKLKANAGLHGVVYSVSGKTYMGLQPRLSLRYSLPDNISLKASYSYMQQFLQTLTNGGVGIPVELWVPTTDKVKPQGSQQVSIGAAQTREGDIEVSVEAYYKQMTNLLEYEEGASYLDNTEPWYDKIETGRGKAYGLEIFVQKKTGRFTGFAGYTLSWNRRQFDNLNNGEWYYSRYDHRHDLKATGNYKLNNEHFDISATFIFATGSAVTVPVGWHATIFPGTGGTLNGVSSQAIAAFFIPEYESRGNYRMQPYHRLDLNLNYSFTTRRVEHKASVGLYNAYSRLNPFYIQYDYNRFRYVSVSLFPIMPAASYSIKF